MLWSYIKIAVRNFIKQRVYSLINVLGLTLGLACSLLITLYITDELSYDRQHPDEQRIYRIAQTFGGMEEPLYLGTSSPQVGPLLRDAFTEVEQFARIRPVTEVFTDARGSKHDEKLVAADTTVFSFVATDWIAGDPATALTDPGSIVITRSFARKYFGDEAPLGQTLVLGNERTLSLRVTGLIEDLPYNMHFSTSAFLSMALVPALTGPNSLQNWDNANFPTYIKLRPGADYEALADAFSAAVIGAMPEPMRKDWQLSGLRLRDIHLHAPLQGLGPPSSGNLENVMVLAVIATGLLLLAGINFVNLASARSLQRNKEIAVRKAIGSSRGQLFLQFMGESLLMVMLAFLLALIVTELALPALNAFTGKAMHVSTLWASASTVLLLLSALLLIAFLAGFYPALYLSALRPSDTAVASAPGCGRVSFRNLLVIIQFAMSIALVIATLVVRSQVQLGRNVELGFNKDQMLVLQKPFTSSGNPWPAFRNELLTHPQILAATASSASPFRVFVSQFDIRYEGGSEPTLLTEMRVDYDFFEAYEVPLLSGRVFSEQYGSDVLVRPDAAMPLGTGAFILSRAAVEQLGWDPGSAVGKWVERDFSEDFSRTVRGPVIGVVENMRLESLREPMKQTYYHLAPPGEVPNYMSLRLSGRDLPETLAFIDAAWARHYSGYPVNRQFLDVDFQELYAKEERFIQLLSVFAFLSIAISCLGLFGLTAFTVERKTKEIGVRKVMGGSVWSIVLLLTNDFSKLVLIANVIAWPVAYFTMSRWLESFAERVDLTPLVFIGSGLIALCIAWVTVGGTAAKAASQKPVLALRYE